MNYAQRKRSLDIKPTHLDTGFPVDFGFSKYEVPAVLPGKVRDRRKEPSGRPGGRKGRK